MYNANIDYDRLLQMLIPTFLRKRKIKAFLSVLIFPIKILKREFLQFKQATIYKITHNGQVVYLQKVLNDHFDRQQRRIYITDGVFYDPTYVYTHQEDKPVYIGTQYLYTSEELALIDVDFLIVVPKDFNLTDDMLTRFHALVKYYKLVSKTYRIIKKQ
ncbi:hypothetical protein HN014_08175 [Aquimarina sp. TRL1]|uniref:hypothetical protein n=1 Tax=Aquimarina sp. (strain TRL1) TaxID=2736252 RepID=UPI00158C44D4|nr:hypothetical protein [Aquimarina sp. TRL1]QKX04895.1 hypothetical protein HN014_08175 [Aquimarina sp. TRL1]